MNKKKLISRIFIVFTILLVINMVMPCFSSDVMAKVNKSTSEGTEEMVRNVAASLLQTAMGPLGNAVSSLVLIIVALLYLLFCAVFLPATGSFPTLDGIIFNRIPFFDPNFVNPDPSSLAQYAKEVVGQIYATGYVVGGSIFVIGAMIIGMKLALSSVATEKAYYKEMVVMWLKGLVLLFSVHILVTGVFYLNEQIVEQLSNQVSNENLHFEESIQPPGIVGRIVSKIAGTIQNLVKNGEFDMTQDFTISGDGLGGLIVVLTAKAVIEGDLIAAVAVAMMLGQTLALSIHYLKRVFICLALGALAPYIVAMDFVKKLV